MKRSEELLNLITMIVGDCYFAIEQSNNEQNIAFQSEKEREQKRVEMLTARLEEIKTSIEKRLNQ